MVWPFNNSNTGKAAQTKTEGESASATANADAVEVRKSTSSAVPDAAPTAVDAPTAVVQDVSRKASQAVVDNTENANDNTISSTAPIAINIPEQSVDSTEPTVPSVATVPAVPTVPTVPTLPTVSNATNPPDQSIEPVAGEVKQTTAGAVNTSVNTPVNTPANTPVEKTRSHGHRPKMSSHDSVGDKFKHVLRLDHWDHKAERMADASTKGA